MTSAPGFGAENAIECNIIQMSVSAISGTFLQFRQCPAFHEDQTARIILPLAYFGGQLF